MNLELSSGQLHIEMSVISTRWRYKLPRYIRFHHMLWPWRGVEFCWFAKKDWDLLQLLCALFYQPQTSFTHSQSRPDQIHVSILTHCQSPPCWRQEVTNFILCQTAPGCFTIYSSNELSQVIGPWSELWHFHKVCKHWGAAKDHPSPKDTMLS